MSGQPSMFQESLRAFLKPILKYLDDESVTEIMVNGPDEVWIETHGKLVRTDARFTDEGLTGAARNIAQFVGRVLNDERPRLDARLPDGSRIHVVLAPVARKGTTVTIRKFFKGQLGIAQMIEFGTLTPQMAHLIHAMVASKLNVMVAGGTSSGKTTLLNIFSTLIPEEERLVTIEDSAELKLSQEHVVALESRMPDKFGKGEVNMMQLLDSALRLRPDRIIVGEVRGGEAFNLIQAMNTGHGGSMATLHANTPTDALRRLESLCLMSSVDMPLIAVRSQVSAAVQAVICCERFPDGARRVVSIGEVLPLDERGDYRTQNLFVFAPTHRDAEGRTHGYFAPTGLVPNFLARLRANGFADVDESFFDPAAYGLPPPPSLYFEKSSTRWAPSLKHRERGLADPPELQQAQSRLNEVALRQEKERRDKLTRGAALEGFSFPVPGKDAPASKPRPAAAPAAVEAEATAVTPLPPAAAAARLDEDDDAPYALPEAFLQTSETDLPPTALAAAREARRPPRPAPPAREELPLSQEITMPPQEIPGFEDFEPVPPPPPRPLTPRRTDPFGVSTVQISDELAADIAAATPRASSNLPPGKRPLPTRTPPPRPLDRNRK